MQHSSSALMGNGVVNVTNNKAKIPLLLKGTWHVPGSGLLKVDDDYIDKLCTNYKQNVLGHNPYVTFGHLTDSLEENSIDGERKRGDLEEIVLENDVVYGIYKLKDETYNLIVNGDYEYSSPEIRQNFRDKATGELKGPVLLRTALTNSPFMPFSDNKITLLSQSADANDSDPAPSFYIKLSTNIEQVSQQPMTTTPSENNTSVESPKTGAPSFDLSALESLLERQAATLSESVNALKTTFTTELEALKAKTDGIEATFAKRLENVTEEIKDKAKQIEATSQYVTLLSSSEKAARLNQKLNTLFTDYGVAPSALKYAKDLIQGAPDEVIKLSVNGQETVASLEDRIVELIKLSANAVPSSSQLGTPTPGEQQGYMKNLIAKNREAATKKAGK
jgi:hypothetical protein